jgi:hypothetical protein
MTVLSDFESRIFTERRIRLFGSAILGANLAILVWSLLTGGSAITRDGAPNAVDFACFYISGIFAASAVPASVYSYPAFSAAQAALVGSPFTGLPHFHFLYPPNFLFFTYPLALLPYVVAFVAWVASTFLVYQAAVYAVLPRAATLIAAAVPIAVTNNAQLGQNGFLTAGLMGLALVCVERRPVLAGVFVGLLTYKPQFGVLFPFALMAAGRWRVIASAAATALILAITAGAVFGHDVWSAFFDTIRGFDARLSPDERVEFLYQSVFAWLHWWGVSPILAWSAHALAAAVVAGVVCTIWFLPAPYPLKAAALCIGAVAITPYVLAYDLCILTIAVAFLARDGLARGFCVGERTVLLLCVAVPLLLAKPIGPVLYAALLGVAVWRLLALRGNIAPALATVPARV